MRRSLIVAGALVAALLWTSVAEAAFPGENGKIAYEDRGRVFVADGPTARGERLRWRIPGFSSGAFRGQASIFVSSPEIAPDGRRAVVSVFTKRRVHAGKGGVEQEQFLGLITLGGTVQTRVLDSRDLRGTTSMGDATFSPDGKRIAFSAFDTSDGRPHIYEMDSDGTDVEKLTDGFDPAFSPDGGRLAFSRREGPDGERNFGIYVIKRDANNTRRIGSGRDPDYSPDGDQIVFVDSLEANEEDCQSEPTLSVMDSDGSNVRHLRRGSDCGFGSNFHGFSAPSFSSDGGKMLFKEFFFDERPREWINVMDADGSNERLAFNSRAPLATGIGSSDWGPRPEGGPSGRCSRVGATILGTALADQIFGTKGRDVIQAAGGDDVIRGGRRGDRICGGPGDDRIKGHKGPDRLVGGPGNDLLRGNQGREALFGGKGFDRCFGGKGRDAARCEREKSAS